MKKIYTLILFSFIALLSKATIWPVTVNSSSFSPATVNAVCGDTVRWTLGSGSHTTTSTTIPGCGTAWNAPINSTTSTYSVVVPCAGTYNYKCTPHGFTGTITVTCTNGVASINNNFSSSAYPIPFSNKLTIETSDADMIALYNIIGENIRTITLPHGQTQTEINTADLKDGIYLYSVFKEGVVVETKKIVKN
ncbi:MAG: T9SS type A sorting domain-containing protein [Bacteroidetes bacterium]|nr:T9SS type A sorting domain-containing protein [Bacteroidota bacterium]